MADDNSIKTIRETSPWLVRYIGRKEALIAAGVATDEMFPGRGKKRRCSRPDTRRTPSYFATSRRGSRFVVTRWINWNDEAGAKREAEQQLEVSEKFDRIQKIHEARDAAIANPTLTYEALVDLPSFYKRHFEVFAEGLRSMVVVSPVMDAKVAGGDELADRLLALAHEIGRAEIKRISKLTVVPRS